MNERQWFESFIAKLKEKGISFENPLSLALVKVVNKDYENHVIDYKRIRANSEVEARLEYIPNVINATSMLFMPPDTERLYQGDDYLEYLRTKMRDPSSFSDEEIKRIYNLAKEGNIIIDQIDKEVEGISYYCHVFVTNDNKAKITKASEWDCLYTWHDQLRQKKKDDAEELGTSNGYEAEFVNKEEIEEHKQHYTPAEKQEMTDNGYTVEEFNKVAYQIFKLGDYKDMKNMVMGVTGAPGIHFDDIYDNPYNEERYNTVSKLCDKYKWAFVEQPLLCRAIRYPEWYQGEQGKRLVKTAKLYGKTANGALGQKYGTDVFERAYAKGLLTFDKALRKKLKLSPFQQPVLGSVKDYQGKVVNLNDYDSYAKFYYESGEHSRPFTVNGKLYVYDGAEHLTEALTVDQTHQIEAKYNELVKKFRDNADDSELCKRVLLDLEYKQKLLPDVKRQFVLSNDRLQNIWILGEDARSTYMNEYRKDPDVPDTDVKKRARYEALEELNTLMKQVADKTYEFAQEKQIEKEDISREKVLFAEYLAKVKNDLRSTGSSTADSVKYQNFVEGVDVAIKYAAEATSKEELKDISDMLGDRASRYYYENIDLPMSSKAAKRFNIASKIVAMSAGITKDKDILINDIATKMVMYQAREMVEGHDGNNFDIGFEINRGMHEREFRIDAIKNSTRFIAMVNGKSKEELTELFKQSPEKLLDKVKPDYEVARMKEKGRPERLIRARNFIRTYKELLDETGTTRGDSEEFKNLKTALDRAYKRIAQKSTVEAGDMVLDELAKAANSYYIAKIDQSMNDRRARRFKIAEILRNGMKDVTPEQKLRDRIAGKILVTEAKKMQQSSSEATVNKGENILKDMTAFNQAVGKIQETVTFKKLIGRKNREELDKTFKSSVSKVTEDVMIEQIGL